MKNYTDDEIKYMAGHPDAINKYEINGYLRGFRDHEKLSKGEEIGFSQNRLYSSLIDLAKNYISDDLKKRTELMENDDYDDKILTEIDTRIINQIKLNGEILEIDYILETLTKLGFAPNLIYDDNGLFGISTDCYQQVVCGEEKMTEPITLIVEEDIWYPTIREAVIYYLKNI